MVFGRFRDRFDAVRSGLEATGRDPRNRDAFLLLEEVAGVLRELRPDEGLGEAMMAAAALVHHAYLFWSDGERVREIPPALLTSVLEPSRLDAPTRTGSHPARPSEYVQLPSLALWGRLESGPPEPVDGWFRWGDGAALTVLAVLGFHPNRAGLTAVEVSGARPDRLEREDGSEPFAAVTTDTGARAGLGSVSGEAELLELAWRMDETT